MRACRNGWIYRLGVVWEYSDASVWCCVRRSQPCAPWGRTTRQSVQRRNCTPYCRRLL